MKCRSQEGVLFRRSPLEVQHVLGLVLWMRAARSLGQPCRLQRRMRGATCLGTVDVARVPLNTVCDADSGLYLFCIPSTRSREKNKNGCNSCHIRGTGLQHAFVERFAVEGHMASRKASAPRGGKKRFGCPTGQRAPRGAFAIFGRSGLEQRLAVVETPTSTQTQPFTHLLFPQQSHNASNRKFCLR